MKKSPRFKGVLGYARLSDVPEEELKNTCSLFKNDGGICLGALNDSKQDFIKNIRTSDVRIF
jgi:hypothetical protein